MKIISISFVRQIRIESSCKALCIVLQANILTAFVVDLRQILYFCGRDRACLFMNILA